MLFFGFVIFCVATLLTITYRNEIFKYNPTHFKFWLNIEKTKLALATALFGATVIISVSIFSILGLK